MKSEPTTIQLIVRVSDGSFESSLSIPVASTEKQRNEFAKMWTDAMATAFKGTWISENAIEQAEAAKYQQAAEEQK
ncbi:MAG TPA: hypothetical protein VMC85_20870 [Desulfomonilaceae bacterium]|nr:hypothetical protein [Desulfomonilaceae bacterium]